MNVVTGCCWWLRGWEFILQIDKLRNGWLGLSYLHRVEQGINYYRLLIASSVYICSLQSASACEAPLAIMNRRVRFGFKQPQWRLKSHQVFTRTNKSIEFNPKGYTNQSDYTPKNHSPIWLTNLTHHWLHLISWPGPRSVLPVSWDTVPLLRGRDLAGWACLALIHGVDELS